MDKARDIKKTWLGMVEKTMYTDLRHDMKGKVRNVSSRGPCKKNYQDSIFTLTKITNMSFLV
jgi:hypothetical protein